MKAIDNILNVCTCNDYHNFVTETISVLENAQRKTTSNYAGGDTVGSSWTDKVMGFKGSSSMDDKQKQPLPHEQVEGVDDDEWVSVFNILFVRVCMCVRACVCVCVGVCVRQCYF